MSFSNLQDGVEQLLQFSTCFMCQITGERSGRSLLLTMISPRAMADSCESAADSPALAGSHVSCICKELLCSVSWYSRQDSPWDWKLTPWETRLHHKDSGISEGRLQSPTLKGTVLRSIFSLLRGQGDPDQSLAFHKVIQGPKHLPSSGSTLL